MAKTSYQIYMDFKNAKKQADRLDDIAKTIENTANNDLMGSMNQLASEWKSETSNTYRQKGQKVSGNLVSVAKNLRNTASTIRTMAQNTYDAEMQALELAKRRAYK